MVFIPEKANLTNGPSESPRQVLAGLLFGA